MSNKAQSVRYHDGMFYAQVPHGEDAIGNWDGAKWLIPEKILRKAISAEGAWVTVPHE
jgi:hypothetical protein